MSDMAVIEPEHIDCSDWVLDEELIRQYLNGRLVFVPSSLVDFVESQKGWRIEKREVAYLVWQTVYSATKYDKSCRYRPVHHEDLAFGSERTVISVRNALISAGFIQEPYNNNWLAGKFSMKYRAPYRQEITPVHLKVKSLFSCDGRNACWPTDRHSNYTRHCLDQLVYDEETIVCEVQRIIANYKIKKIEKARKEERRDGKKKKKEGIRNAEEALYKLGKPLFELIHKRGRVSRSKEYKGGRLFSPYAFLMTEFRPLFVFEGQKMAMIDAVESQVNLLGNISGDQKLIEDTLDRRFYQQVAEEFDLRNEAGEIHRNEGKDPFYRYAFANYKPSYFLTPYMARHYPKADKFMEDHKAGDYRKASWLLQGYESRIFLNGVYQKLRMENIPSLTIHDGIACPEEFGSKVKGMVEEEFKRVNVKGTVKLDILAL